jgi:hypothetical protein
MRIRIEKYNWTKDCYRPAVDWFYCKRMWTFSMYKYGVVIDLTHEFGNGVDYEGRFPRLARFLYNVRKHDRHRHELQVMPKIADIEEMINLEIEKYDNIKIGALMAKDKEAATSALSKKEAMLEFKIKFEKLRGA